ncbi:F-box/LRR-repeat protein [Thalictrum thalictroides]|uniref:F-box/LRR-repeat protein n=1 Tax=Thalictrum thalictroides TaxID=46969 RepID=A0A7J6V9Z3_THATH|nr:F-box/LRR-repeat protein [Thalictrum thalictroides]
MEVGRKWEDLNIDCLVKVFERVGVKSLVSSVPLVCKPWYKASLDPQCWKDLDFQDVYPATSTTSSRVQPTTSPLTKLIKLSVLHSRGTAVRVVFHEDCTLKDFFLILGCPSLKMISLPKFLDNHHIEAIPFLIGKWTKLETLCMNSDRILVETLTQIRNNCKNFKSLTIFIHSTILTDKASAIVALLPKIKELTIRATYLPRVSLQLILLGCKGLELLDARDCVGFDEDDLEIWKMALHIKNFMCKGSVENPIKYS